ncbi:MAG: hypothetical protein HQK99_06730 [Nitrospirae bacterium]|nr:hypothetical protein [Nitrospirota bacterium]
MYITAPVAAITKGAYVDSIERLSDAFQLKLMLKKYMEPCTVKITTSRYTYNFPLSLAITAVFISRIHKKKQAIIAVIAMLTGVHFLYLYSLETLALTRAIYDKNLRDVGWIEMNVHLSLFLFTDGFLIRLEPFIAGFVLYFKFMRKN